MFMLYARNLDYKYFTKVCTENSVHTEVYGANRQSQKLYNTPCYSWLSTNSISISYVIYTDTRLNANHPVKLTLVLNSMLVFLATQWQYCRSITNITRHHCDWFSSVRLWRSSQRSLVLYRTSQPLHDIQAVSVRVARTTYSLTVCTIASAACFPSKSLRWILSHLLHHFHVLCA